MGFVLAPLWVPLVAATMRFVLRWRLGDVSEVRALYRRVRSESDAPLMVCANHLTMVDSFLIAWALASPWRYLFDYAALPWNTPERTNFASLPWQRLLAWVAKCIPVTRGGDRAEMSRTLAQVQHVMANGESVLMFPEGGRSRSGRVDPRSAAWGVGRLVRSLPDCRVLCVYLRGRGQESMSTLPRRGERFQVRAVTLEPKAQRGGLRGSVEVARQITGCLAALESDFLAEGGLVPAPAAEATDAR